MNEQNAQSAIDESTSVTKNEWLSFIRRQIEYEAERQKRLGVSLWLICGSILLLGERFLSNLYLIPSSKEYVDRTMTSAVLVLSAALCFLTQAICIAQLYSRPKMLTRAPSHGLFLAHSYFSNIIIPGGYSIVINYLFIKGIHESIQILMVINLFLTTLWLRISIVSKSVFNIVAKNSIFSKLTLFCIKYFSILGLVLIIVTFFCSIQLIVDISRLQCSLPEIELGLILPIIIVLVMGLMYVLYSINVSNSYKDLENEIVLSNLNTAEILEALKKYFYGYSAVEWFDARIEVAEAKRDMALDLLKKKYSEENYEKVVRYAEEASNSLEIIITYVNFAKKAMLLTYVEDNYYKKCIKKLIKVTESIKQIISQIKNNLAETTQPVAGSNDVPFE